MSRFVVFMVLSGIVYGGAYMSGRCKERQYQLAKR